MLVLRFSFPQLCAATFPHFQSPFPSREFPFVVLLSIRHLCIILAKLPSSLCYRFLFLPSLLYPPRCILLICPSSFASSYSILPILSLPYSPCYILLTISLLTLSSAYLVFAFHFLPFRHFYTLSATSQTLPPVKTSLCVHQSASPPQTLYERSRRTIPSPCPVVATL